jgi:hypothetical protein
VGSLNNVPSQVRTTVVPEVPSPRRWEVRLFWAVLISFGRFQRRYAPKTHLDSGFQARYGTLFKECTRTVVCSMVQHGQIDPNVAVSTQFLPTIPPRAPVRSTRMTMTTTSTTTETSQKDGMGNEESQEEEETNGNGQGRAKRRRVTTLGGRAVR